MDGDEKLDRNARWIITGCTVMSALVGTALYVATMPQDDKPEVESPSRGASDRIAESGTEAAPWREQSAGPPPAASPPPALSPSGLREEHAPTGAPSLATADSPEGVSYFEIAERIEERRISIPPELQPTLFGLIEATIGRWSCWPEVLREEPGFPGLPTIKDVAQGYEDPKVQELLKVTLKAEVALGILKSANADELDIANAQASMDTWRAALCRRLEEVTSFPSWSMVDELWWRCVSGDE